MASAEERLEALQAKFDELETKYKDSTQKISELEQVDPRGRPVVVTRERKPKRFNGLDGNVLDFVTDMGTYLESRLFTPLEKVEHILECLDHPAKTEIKFQLDVRNTTVNSIFDVLKSTFGVRDTTIELERKFFDRNQRPTESLSDYSYALIELLFPLQEMDTRFRSEQDKYLKEKFADGVKNVQLRRELKRINTESPKLKFNEPDNQRMRMGQCNETRSAVQNTDPLEEILKLQKQQQEELRKLAKDLGELKQTRKQYSPRYQSKSKDWDNKESQSKKDPITCNYCKGPNHIVRDCIKLKNKKRYEASQQVQAKQQSVNSQAPASRAGHWEQAEMAQQTESSH